MLADAALRYPLHYHAVAQLEILRVLLDEEVEPVEGALVGDANGEHDLVLAIGRLRGLGHCHIGVDGVRHHAARERQRRQRHRAAIHMDRRVLERHHRVQSLALQRLRQLLRLADAEAVREEADRVEIRMPSLEVEHNSENGAMSVRDTTSTLRASLVVQEAAEAVEADGVLGIAHEEIRVGRAETEVQGESGRKATPVFARAQVFENLHFEHVPALAHAEVRAGAGEQMLHSAFAQGCEHAVARGLHEVQGRVLHEELGRLGVLGFLACRGILLKLLRRLRNGGFFLLLFHLGILGLRLRGGLLPGLLLLRRWRRHCHNEPTGGERRARETLGRGPD
mmetsp:Transcript_4110/g.11434  ORF Transcript_4110/g.11434 Transcript_4110/m.11434 type:complete len:338 (-) Transcript_4110:26-1039(-)